MKRILSLILFIIMGSFSFAENIPYKIEVGNYFSGISAFKRENAHLISTATYFDKSEMYSRVNYRYAKYLQLNVGSLINKTSRDGIYENIFIKDQLSLDLKLNPFFISLMSNKELTHTIVSYKNNMGISYFSNELNSDISQSKVSVNQYNVFTALKLMKFDLDGAFSSIEVDNQLGNAFKFNMGFSMPYNKMKHNIRLGVLGTNIKNTDKLTSNQLFLNSFSESLFISTFNKNEISSRLQYNVEIPLESMTFEVNLDALPIYDMYLLKVSNHYFISQNLGVLSQLIISNPSEEKLIRIKLIWQR